MITRLRENPWDHRLAYSPVLVPRFLRRPVEILPMAQHRMRLIRFRERLQLLLAQLQP